MIHASEQSAVPSQDVLVTLLHSLSQPLTALHLSLELSASQDPEASAVVSAALEQTDRVIEIIRLMREYLDSEQQGAAAQFVPVATAVQEVLEELSVAASARDTTLLASLRSAVAIAVPGFWLHRALHYLIGSLVEDAPFQGTIVVLLEDRTRDCLLSMHTLPGGVPANRRPQRTAGSDTLRQVRLAIARRALEAGGASLEPYGAENPGFLISIPPSEPQISQLFV